MSEADNLYSRVPIDLPLLDQFKSMFQYYGTPFIAVDSSPIGCVQWRFLYSASFILNIDHNPHDYQPVMLKLGLVPLKDKRIEVNL